MNINKILFITLSNIGDCILTLPALDAVRENFPHAEITVISGPRPKEIFENNPNIKKLIIFDKRSSHKDRIKLLRELKREQFDVIIDLRNSFFGALLPARFKTSAFTKLPKDIRHMKDVHLFKVRSVLKSILNKFNMVSKEKIFSASAKDRQYIDNILEHSGVTGKDKVIVLSPGARSHIKRWGQERFAELADALIEEIGAKVVLAGSKEDSAVAKFVSAHCKNAVIDLSGKTSISELAALLERSSLIITNDSANLHLASYLEVPVVAVFGPTDESKYGPWSKKNAVVRKHIFCRPCQQAQCRYSSLKCMEIIQVSDVMRMVRKISGTGQLEESISQAKKFKRILIVRTDRIGDVLLSTPVIEAVREEYPESYIAMMVQPYAKEIVEGNPYLDEVIIFDKGGRHKNWMNVFAFIRFLKHKKFDLAIILHPANSVHLVIFHSRIPRRLGYDKKHGFLLTDRVKHTKQLGEKHESQYCLDLLRSIGIEPKKCSPYFPIKKESEKWVEELFSNEGVKDTDKLLAIHPGASCPSKIWPSERFAETADKLIDKYGFKAFVVSGPKDTALTRDVVNKMKHKAVDLGGKTSVSQMASLLKRCDLFISNDSGPVHIGSSVGVPVISIFGRSQMGLGPKRWGPLGKKDKFIHKNAGCIECLAHNCVKGFACLRAIGVSDVLSAADEVLKTR